MDKTTTFESFCTQLKDFSIINDLEELLKKFFYNKFVNKIKKMEKEGLKKAKKL